MTPVLISIIIAVSAAAIVAVVLLIRAINQRNQADTKAREATAKTDQLETELAAATAAHEARIEEMEKTRDDLDAHFKGIAAEITQTNQEAFLKQAKEQFATQHDLGSTKIDGLLKPIAETLKKFESHVGDIEEKRITAYERVNNQVGKLSSETEALRQILGSSMGDRGRWGEQTLRNVLEFAGMSKHIDFNEQVRLNVEPSNKKKHKDPDVVVYIPGGSNVVIDSKAIIEDYKRAHDAEDKNSQQEYLAAHARSVLGTAKELSERDYANLVNGSPDFVVMFLPSDALLIAALDGDTKLLERAWIDHKVLIVTPSSLIAFLQTVAAAWQQHDLHNNAQEIIDEAAELYDRLGILVEHVNKVSHALNNAVNAQNAAIGSLESRFVASARKIKELGAHAKKEITSPQTIKTRADSITKPELTGLKEPEELAALDEPADL